MLKILLLLLLLNNEISIFFAKSTDTSMINTSNSSYMKLSGMVYKSYNKIDVNFDSNTKPGELSSLRKSLLMTRSYLDIFCYAYPIGNDQDIFLILRDSLNKGYTEIGDFDDLQHVNATNSDIKKYLDKCLKWKDEYQSVQSKFDIDGYLKSPNDKLFFRNKTDLSKDFWGNVKQVPLYNISGYQNIGLLSKGQIENCLNDYDNVISIDNLCTPETHDQFHNYRKLIRSTILIPSTFDQVYSDDPSTIVSFLIKVHTNFGKINDQINEYEWYIKKGDNQEAQKKKSVVSSMWSDLKNWLNDENYIPTLKKLYSMII